MPDSPLEPLTLPRDLDGWRAFADERPRDLLDRVTAIDLRLISETELTLRERLSLWNEADIALAEAAAPSHLLSESHPDEGVRDAAEKQAQLVDAVQSRRLLDTALWAVFSDADDAALDADEQRLLAQVRRDFRRGGVDLSDAERERVRELAERDTTLSLTFSRNIREGRREIRVPASSLGGLPADFLDAHPADAEGMVTLTTEYTDLMPVREYASDRAVRHALVGAYNDLAWPENEAVLAELLAVRAERAALLGYGDWADYETETRMIGSSAAVASFLDQVAAAVGPAASAEYDRVLARLQRDDPDAAAVTIADFWYVLGALKREEYDVDAQLVRSYFRFDRVLDGVLATTGRLLDVEYVPVAAPSWHDDVRTYDVVRRGERLGRIHLDLHPRDGKYNHAACFGLAPGIAGRALPESVLLCNFSRGLLEHDEVVTFFHEFGHLVHDILGGHQKWARWTGVATEWDFVEAPSQLLEEWAWDAEALASFARDDDGEPIPADLVARMRTADAFGRALEVTRQLGHATTSYRLHVERPADLREAVDGYYRAASPITPLDGAHSYAGFGHLTGYGACYYTYQWSLVIARDLLSAFANDLFDADTATRYRREILEPGGTRDARDLVRSFLGRESTFDAYRRWLAGE
ncbi:M3 family metallopeptidase [uncultured Microbacterium sp.]|uniref:M3 family metallopeptidase n=1 Tax=uncultured Microbacterium sp. TaxID=191216 RepID=UPI0025DDD4CC|nr:M3 family metallopeptidase [uncultured Microbacterium sp.]